ncbi:unnamed protein product [Ranitomeya imitator]|uniref:Helix-turn-helix domain-containing protein n=1 Tax=Ranitomeya imitator TaxID=111125 RepID=A0ABN9LSZ7_9NEOB|nr:unnamed protein product [Ranitomeya imitator]
MGSNVAPPYANCFMSVFESDYVYSNALFKSHCILWRRYIDNVFCLWRGTGESLLEFFDQINSVWPELSFTLNFDRTEINFLDTNVIQKSDGTLTIDLFVKDTDRNNLLLYQSCHPKAVKRSIPQSQFERVRRIVSVSTLCSQRLDEMETKFLQRGYPRRILQRSRRTVSRDREYIRYLSFRFLFCPALGVRAFHYALSIPSRVEVMKMEVSQKFNNYI